MYFPTRVHSHYSLLMSTLQTEDIIDWAVQNKLPAIGLTDYTNLGGVIEFVSQCVKNKIKPIIGCELIISNDTSKQVGTITLLCKNKKSWSSLVNIVSESNSADNFNKVPSIPIEQLSRYDLNDFICIDGYEGSRLHETIFSNYRESYFYHEYDELAENCLDRFWQDEGIKYIASMKKLFSDYYLETTVSECCSNTNPLPLLLIGCIEQLAKLTNVKVLIDNSAYYQNAIGAADQRVLLASKLKCTLRNLGKKIKEASLLDVRLNIFLNSTFYKLQELPSSYHNEIFDKVEVFDVLSQPKLPKFSCPNNVSEIEYLKELCRIGWKKILDPTGRLLTHKEVYTERIKRELDVIERANLAGYFLIVQDYVNEFRNRGVLIGPGRGCFLPDTRVKMADGTYCPIGSLNIGDLVIDAYGNISEVSDRLEYTIDEDILELEFENGKTIRCTKDHKFLTRNRGWVEAQDLTDDDDIQEV